MRRKEIKLKFIAEDFYAKKLIKYEIIKYSLPYSGLS